MMNILTYIFYPNPGQTTYGSTSVIVALALCGGLIALSIIIKFWRRGLRNAVTKKLSRAWSAICFWYGIVGLILAVSRVEKIQFVAMRFFWILWAISLLLLAFLQFRLFCARHYEVLPRAKSADPRDRYLPGRHR